jgi:hypothetical protein
MYVTNKWNRPLVVDYGCQEVKFEVGKTVELDEAAVRHIFGYGAENKEPYMMPHVKYQEKIYLYISRSLQIISSLSLFRLRSSGSFPVLPTYRPLTIKTALKSEIFFVSSSFEA